MQFVWLNKQGVASDQGFVLQRVERFAFEYREANRTMRLEGESNAAGLDATRWGFGFYASWRTAGWQPPFDDVPVSERDRARIVKNIKDAANAMDGDVDFE